RGDRTRAGRWRLVLLAVGRPSRTAGVLTGRGAVGGGSAPTQLVERVLGDAEVVRDLVDDGHRDLVHQLLLGRAEIAERSAEDRDGVREEPGIGGVAFGERDPLVQAQQVGLLGVPVGDQHHHVVHGREQLVRDRVEGVVDEGLEPGLVDDDGHGVAPGTGTTPGAAPAPGASSAGAPGAGIAVVVGATGAATSMSTFWRADPRRTETAPASLAFMSPQLIVRLPVSHETGEMGWTSVEMSVLWRSASAPPR